MGSIASRFKKMQRIRISIGYIAASFSVVVLILFLFYQANNMFGTGLLLGWDSPGYVWYAKEIIGKGSLSMVAHWEFPQLYTQLLALLGYLSGNTIMMERIMPLFFAMLLIYANFRLALGISGNLHVAGLSALLTSITLNSLRLLADLHRNLMAYSVSMMLLCFIPTMISKGYFKFKRYLFLIIVLLILFTTHIETSFVLIVSLITYSLLSRNPKGVLKIAVACTIPLAVLIALAPDILQYPTKGVLPEPFVAPWQEKSGLTVEQTILWMGGTWPLLVFLMMGVAYLIRNVIKGDRNWSLLVFSWVTTIFSMLVVTWAALPATFSERVLLLLPVSTLLALGVQFSCMLFKGVNIRIGVIIRSLEKRAVSFNPQKFASALIAVLLICGSVMMASSQAGAFLTPYITRRGYDKLLVAGRFLEERGFQTPILLFSNTVWTADNYRLYWGSEFGEHFAYYGEIENLLHLMPTESQSRDLEIQRLETTLSNKWYNELIGNQNYTKVLMYTHSVYIKDKTSVTLHPVVIIAPEFYNKDIPYYLRSFHIGDGIYVVPPNSLTETPGTIYGPWVTAIRDGSTTLIRSEYLYLDPDDPSVVYVRVNGSKGFTSYTFMDLPVDWSFMKLEQGGDLSLPEFTPSRLDGTPASVENDPAETLAYWSVWPYGVASIDSLFKKEGSGSVKASGITNEWSDLFLTYDPPGNWDLSSYSRIVMWISSNVSTVFGINLHDSMDRKRTYWDIRASGQGIDVKWKRAALNLSTYVSEDPGFDASSIDSIAIYAHWYPMQQISYWIDDLTVENFSGSTRSIYKARVSTSEELIAYFTTKEQ